MEPIILGPGEGRTYDCGRVIAHFKADGAETGDRYAISEWVMAPGFDGVGAHDHAANDEIFIGTEGECEIRVGDDWRPVRIGTTVRIPAGVTHDFRNLSATRAAMLNVFLPGGFEHMMPQIVRWFAENGTDR